MERGGAGTPDMIALCKVTGLNQTQFRQDAGQFVQTLWRLATQVDEQAASSLLAYFQEPRTTKEINAI